MNYTLTDYQSFSKITIIIFLWKTLKETEKLAISLEKGLHFVLFLQKCL